MEEIGQIIGELVLQLFFEVFADAIWRRLPEPARLALKVVFSAAFAALLAWISTALFPTPYISSEALRITYVIVGPLLLGGAMASIGRYFVRREKHRSVLEHFGFAWLFAFSFTLTRYLLT